jgi:DNA polymerase III subunit chi
VTEVLFYHLQGHALERVLPMLLEKSLERGWRVALQASSQERIEALDQFLWTFRDDSFLPHATDRDGDVARQPVLLTLGGDNRNAAQVRFLIDGVPLPADAASYLRIISIFDGDDPEAVAAARARWTDSKAKGFDVTYWQADPQGRWQRQA